MNRFYVMAPGARLYEGSHGQLLESTGNYVRTENYVQGRPISGPPGPLTGLGACCGPCGSRRKDYGPIAIGNGGETEWGPLFILVGGAAAAWWVATKLYK